MIIALMISILVILLSFFLIFYFLKKEKINLQNSFKSMSYDLMQQNSESFMNMAKNNFDKYYEGMKVDIESKHKQLESALNPVKDSIEKMKEYTKDIEKQRHGEFSSLNKQIEMLINSENYLREETANLAKALKSPNIRGAWGQIHLRRVVEIAGLLNNCDFYEQTSTVVDDKTYRPDLIVKLPGGKKIIVDAKTPLETYLESQSNESDQKARKLKAHAINLKKHINDLSSKEYFSKFEFAIQYVILFLPAEAILSAAIEIDPTLMEIAAKKNVIIATPVTLIAILKTIAQIWNEDLISKNAGQIAKVGKDLYERLMKMNEHFVDLGNSLSKSVNTYNKAISSLNSRVMPSARKLKDMGLSQKESFLNEISTSCNNSLINEETK